MTSPHSRANARKTSPKTIAVDDLPVDRWQTDIDFIFSDDFREPNAEAVMRDPSVRLHREPKVSSNQSGRGKLTSVAPVGVSASLATLCEMPLLTMEGERHLFRKMNYERFRAARIDHALQTTGKLEGKKISASDRDQWLNQAYETREHIIRANMRLVVSIAKKYVDPLNEFDELVSEGIMSLIGAVEKFDYSRGYRFSTYATRAIRNNYNRSVQKRRQHRVRFMSGNDQVFDAAADANPHARVKEAVYQRVYDTLTQIVDRLDDQKQTIIKSRFGLGDNRKPTTLTAIGAQLGVSRERVRQIQLQAMDELKFHAEEEQIDLPNVLMKALVND